MDHSTHAPGVWQRNLTALGHRHPTLHRLVTDHQRQPVGELVATRTVPNLKYITSGAAPVLAYPPSDPWREIDAAIQKTPRDLVDHFFIFIGMGLGYYPLRLLQSRPHLPRILIIEPSLDLFCTALKAVDLSPLLSSDKVVLLLGETDWEQFQQEIHKAVAADSFKFLEHLPSYQWRESLYRPAKEHAYRLVNEITISRATIQNDGTQCFHNRMANLMLLRRHPPLNLLKGVFQNQPAVLVAAGPSLDRSLYFLREAKGKCVLIAADAALAPLMKNGIRPDLVVTTDFRELNLEKFVPFLKEEYPFTLVASITACPSIPKYMDARHLLLAFHQNDSQAWVHRALNMEPDLPPASSVVHLTLGTALYMGADPIILVGHDFGYADQGQDHAAGTRCTYRIKNEDNLWLPGTYGGRVEVPRAYYEFKTRLEKIIRDHPRTYLNVTAAGAVIEGTLALDPEAVKERWLDREFPVAPVIDRIVADAPLPPLADLIAGAVRLADETRGIREKVAEMASRTRQVHCHLAFLIQSGSQPNTFEDLPLRYRKELQAIQQFHLQLEQDQPLWDRLGEFTAARAQENERLIQAREQSPGFAAWVSKGMEHLMFVQASLAEGLSLLESAVDGLIEHLTREETLLSRAADDETDPEPLLRLAELYLDHDAARWAAQTATRVLEIGPRSEKARFLWGAAQIARLNADAAEETWSMLCSQNPDWGGPIEAQRVKVAGRWLSLIRKYPELALVSRWLARAVRVAGESDTFKSMLSRVFQAAEERIEKFLTKGQINKAFRQLQLWEPAAPHLPAWQALSAKTLAARGEPAAAARELEKALEAQPQNAVWQALLARYLFESGCPSEGIEALNKATALDPGTATLWEELGDVLRAEKDFPAAAAAYERCFINLPQRLDLLIKIGDCYRLDHKTQAARAAYQALLEKMPGHSGAMERLQKT